MAQPFDSHVEMPATLHITEDDEAAVAQFLTDDGVNRLRQESSEAITIRFDPAAAKRKMVEEIATAIMAGSARYCLSPPEAVSVPLVNDPEALRGVSFTCLRNGIPAGYTAEPLSDTERQGILAMMRTPVK